MTKRAELAAERSYDFNILSCLKGMFTCYCFEDYKIIHGRDGGTCECPADKLDSAARVEAVSKKLHKVRVREEKWIDNGTYEDVRAERHSVPQLEVDPVQVREYAESYLRQMEDKYR